MAIVAHGNLMFPRPREYAGDRSDITVKSFPKLLRSVAMRLAQQGCWLSFPIDTVAKDWNGDPAVNLARLNDIMAHADELTEAQVSYLRAAIRKLQERSQ
jgi:hypothetical protein